MVFLSHCLPHNIKAETTQKCSAATSLRDLSTYMNGKKLKVSYGREGWRGGRERKGGSEGKSCCCTCTMFYPSL